MPDAVGGGVGGQPLDHVPLVEAREDRRLCRSATGRPCLLLVHEPLAQVEPVVPRPDLLPQVGGGIRAVGRRVRVSGSAGLAGAVGSGVEGQEAGVLASELGGEGDAVEEKGEVELVPPAGLLGGVDEFTYDGEAVGPVGVEHGVGGDEIRLEVWHAEADAPVLDAVTEDGEQAVVAGGGGT